MIVIAEIKKLCTAAEFAVVKRSLKIKGAVFEGKTLLADLKRLKDWKKKYTDLARKQSGTAKRATRKSGHTKGKSGSDAAKRTKKKAEIFNEALSRYAKHMGINVPPSEVVALYKKIKAEQQPVVVIKGAVAKENKVTTVKSSPKKSAANSKGKTKRVAKSLAELMKEKRAKKLARRRVMSDKGDLPPTNPTAERKAKQARFKIGRSKVINSHIRAQGARNQAKRDKRGGE